MTPSRSAEQKSVIAAALIFAALFTAAGLVLLPYPGIQNDEALFAGSLYPPHASAYSIGPVPIMVMDYVGCLKTWIYAPVFALFPPSPWSLRVPAILIGALSVFLFTILLGRAGGRRAAFLGGALLVTDPVFALTNNFDWGPVALQHFFLIAGLLAATEFHRTQQTRWLALAGFCFGLGLWEKAIFLWLFLPVCAAAIAIWPRVVRTALSLQNAAAAISAFILGAAPLLWFNITHQWVTFRSHTVFSLTELPAKLRVLHATANGSALFGYMVRGAGKMDLLEWGFALTLVALPFVWRTRVRRPALFSLIVMLGAWVQMAFNRDTGGAAHHAILLWPSPQMTIALVFARFRIAGPAVTAILVFSNVLVFHQYWTDLRTEGPSIVWTDAIAELSADTAFTAADPICIIDWGLVDALQILHQGALPLRAEQALVLASEPSEVLTQYLHNPKTLWTSHVTGQEFTPGLNSRLVTTAERRGLRKQPVCIYKDRHGRPIFETFRFIAP